MITFAKIRRAYLVLLTLAAPVQSFAEESFADAHAKEIEALLHENFADGNAGMVIGLLDEHGSRVFSSGKLDNGTDQLVDGDTIFEIGSITKTLTSLLLLDMVHRGEMKLDDPVARYLPEWVRVPVHNGKQITLANLATQDSGLPWFPDNLSDKDVEELSLEELKIASDEYTVGDMYEFLRKYSLTKDPGKRFQYSNVGMALLGHVMEYRAGTSYESLVEERICRPLKMKSTRITLSSELKERMAVGHDAAGNTAENVNFQAMASAGSFLSSANDLLKLLSANLGLIKSPLTIHMKQMQIVRHEDSLRFGKTAMPWFDEGVYNPPGSELWGHGGGGFGYLAFIGFDKLKGRGVVVLSSQTTLNSSGIGWTILQEMPLTSANISYLVREIVGAGIVLDKNEQTGIVRITKVFPESPAGRAGLTAGLVLQKINGVSVNEKQMNECLRMLGGQIGKRVRLELVNPELKEVRTVELTRQKFLTSS